MTGIERNGFGFCAWTRTRGQTGRSTISRRGGLAQVWKTRGQTDTKPGDTKPGDRRDVPQFPQHQSVGSCAPTYDADGNLTKDCSFTTPYTYTWNADGNPATLNGVGLTYDALGREAEIASGSNYTQVLYSPIGKLGLMNGQTANTVRVPLPGGSTAELLVGYDRTLHADWLGSSRLSTSYYNRILAYDAAYAPYGENYAGTGASGDLNFTGQSQDTLSGMYDFQYREYNPVQGRWISPDPSGTAAADPTSPQSWNRYAYALNNPLSYRDPSGLECVWDDGSYDSEDDPDTGDIGDCGDAGGTWVELGQLGGWSGQADASNAQLVNSIQNGLVASVNIIGADGQNYSTFYNSAGQATGYISPNGSYAYDPAILAGWLQTGFNYLQQGLNYLKSHPVTISVNEIFAGQVTYQASTGAICGSVGAGASVPPTKAVTVGLLNNGSGMSNWQQAISGPSYSFGSNFFFGYQGTFSSSGNVGGPSVSGIGLSGSYTIGGCTTIP